MSQRRSGATVYELQDRMGSSVRQTNAGKASTGARTYDAFGMALSSTGAPVGPFGFAGGHGYQEDGDSGLKLLGHRYYDASTGRFLTRDPVKDGRNWYGYCEGNPLGGLDPEGLKIKWDITPGSEGLALSILLWLIEISGTKTGKDIADGILHGDTEYTISVNRNSQLGSSYDYESHRFRFSSGEGAEWSDTDGEYHGFTTMRVVAHEVGHVRENPSNHPPGGDGGEQDTVDKYENPISNELGDSRKRGPYGKTRPKPRRPGGTV